MHNKQHVTKQFSLFFFANLQCSLQEMFRLQIEFDRDITLESSETHRGQAVWSAFTKTV